MTNLNFNQLDNLFKNDDFTSIENDTRGVRFLKLRSMSRNETLSNFLESLNLDISEVSKRDLFRLAFDNNIITEIGINSYIRATFNRERLGRSQNEAYLIDQLSRLQNFDWGGSHGNNLEKNIVDNYVKKIQSFERMNEEIEGNLLISLRGYTLNSWYNHWTSIIIEDLFKEHPNVLPTIGLVKKIDFFY